MLLDSLREMCVFYCVPCAPGEPRGAQGVRTQRPCDQAFRDWLSADVTSVSLPLPSSPPLRPPHSSSLHSLSLSQSFSASLCAALLLSPLLLLFGLSSASPLLAMVCVGGVQATRA